jgi:hypothetical protein
VKPFADSDGEEILCICRGNDDGWELVQCDDCRTWYHLECLGIKDIADLGREEDLVRSQLCHIEVAETTFAPVEEEPPLRRRRDPLFFETLLESPASADWRVQPHSPNPTTPKANPTHAARQRQASHIPDRP